MLSHCFFSLLQQEYNIWKDLLCMTLYIMDEVQKLYCGLASSETYIWRKSMFWGIVFFEPVDSFCEEYDKKNKSDSQKCIRLPLSFFLFLLWVEFSLYPYLNGFILLLIRFPIFR